MADHYTYRVSWSSDDQEYVGLCTEFPSLSHLAADRARALAGIEALVHEVVEDMRASGAAIPEPIAERAFSGQFQTRVPPALHRCLYTEAQEAGVSLNRLVNLKLSAVPLRLGRLAEQAGGPVPKNRNRSAREQGRARA